MLHQTQTYAIVFISAIILSNNDVSAFHQHQQIIYINKEVERRRLANNNSNNYTPTTIHSTIKTSAHFHLQNHEHIPQYTRSALQPKRRNQYQYYKPYYNMNRRGDDGGSSRDEDLISQIIQPLESILLFLSTPIPNNTSSYALPLVYPLTIIALNLLLNSVATIILLDMFFVIFFLFARSAIIQGDGDDDFDKDDDYDRGGENDDYNELVMLDNKVLDLIALFGAVASAAIVSPSGFNFFDSGNIGVGNFIGLVLLAVCSSSGIIVNMRLWDDKYYNSNDNNFLNDYDDGDVREKTDVNDYSTKLISDWDKKFKEFDKDKKR